MTNKLRIRRNIFTILALLIEALGFSAIVIFAGLFLFQVSIGVLYFGMFLIYSISSIVIGYTVGVSAYYKDVSIFVAIAVIIDVGLTGFITWFSSYEAWHYVIQIMGVIATACAITISAYLFRRKNDTQDHSRLYLKTKEQSSNQISDLSTNIQKDISSDEE